MKASFVSSNEWLYPDVTCYTSAGDAAQLHAAPGGYATVQVFLQGCIPGEPIFVHCQGLMDPECYQLKDVRCLYNTNDYRAKTFAAPQGSDTSAWTTRNVPFRVYDGLIPFDEGGDKALQTVCALYLSFPISQDQQPGGYSGTCTVSQGQDEAITLPLSITVHKAVIPRQGTLGITNWYDPRNMADRYSVEMYSEDWFRLMKQMMRLMRRTRQTHFYLPLTYITVTEPSPGQYCFDFSRMLRLGQMALDMGFSVLELGHVFNKNYVTNEAYYLFYRPDGRITYGDTPEGYQFLSHFLPQWTDFLKQHGWYFHAVQHLGDEPDMGMIDNYRILSGVIRKFMPGMKIFDAVVHPELRGAVDYFIPLNSDYEAQKEAFETLRRQGDTLWFYTACGPGGKHLNRMLDMELLRTRLLHWGNRRYHLDGYLHWGFNYWQEDQPNVFEYANAVINDGHTLLPPGDTHICYPGNENGPWMSLRAEQMRAGAEDYELLGQLMDKAPDKAYGILDRIMRSFTDYEVCPLVFDRAYADLLTALDEVL